SSRNCTRRYPARSMRSAATTECSGASACCKTRRDGGRPRMRRTPAAKVASLAVPESKLTIEKHLDWLFREQPTEDYGIDAHVEVVDGEMVQGRLLALQIKAERAGFEHRAPTVGGTDQKGITSRTGS